MTPTHVTVVTGFLGVGKTTALLDLLARRPPGAPWAVLVNDFGAISVDGATLSSSGIAVREVPGGCICCTAGLELRVALVRLLRELSPERLLVEPSGLARPSTVLDALDALGPRIVRQATLGLVDPMRYLDPRFLGHETWLEQVHLADVLIANRCDLATPEALSAFRTASAAAWPPKMHVAETTHGHLDAAWLDLPPGDPAPRWSTVHEAEATGRAFTFPSSWIFRRSAVEQVLQTACAPGPWIQEGALRAKALLRTDRGWLRADAVTGRISWQGTPWRRDSRLELLAPVDPAPDWTAIETALGAARLSSHS